MDVDEVVRCVKLWLRPQGILAHNHSLGWNIVSSYSKSEWEAYGHDMTAGADRYERLEEYMELCYKLWDSWEPDAIIADKQSGVYADPAKVHVVDHQGKYYKSKARHFVAPSPQGRPVLWQAGSSGRGRDFAAKRAEAIFAVHPNVERMHEYSDDLDERLVAFSRKEGSVKLIYGVQTVVAETRQEAQAKHERIKACIPDEGALAWISGHFGLDFAQYDPDEYIQNIEVRSAAGCGTRRGTSRPGAASRDVPPTTVAIESVVTVAADPRQRPKTSYRGPYIKGPVDKPLLRGDVVP